MCNQDATAAVNANTKDSWMEFGQMHL